jgi:citrate synthase
VISAALATFRGFRHGGASDRALTLLGESGTPRDAHRAVARRLRDGESVAGFGHVLYPEGDPRATVLVELAAASGNRLAAGAIRYLAEAGAALLDESPNVDFGLAAIAAAYRLPAIAPALIFAAGRTVGWIAHALEEYAFGELIRPRARYIGPVPPVTENLPA